MNRILRLVNLPKGFQETTFIKFINKMYIFTLNHMLNKVHY